MFRSKKAASATRTYFLALAAILILFCSKTNADFDQATRAYLLGQYEKARYEALVAASDGNAKAQMLLGQLYFNGEGVEKDLAHALYWYNKAAESGFADAQYRLGKLYLDDKDGVKRDLDVAYKWLTKAYENGRKDTKDILEWLFKTEEGKVVNLDENVEVLKQVAASGNQQARFLLSLKMLKGDGTAPDKAGAVKMLLEDAQVGFVKAQKQLGELFYYGNGVDKDYIEAYAWSMAYAGTKDLGGIAREGKQIARSALRKLPEAEHNNAYLKSKDYFESYVLPFHKNAREVGPEKYRIVVRSRVNPDAPTSQKPDKQIAQTLTSSTGNLTTKPEAAVAGASMATPDALAGKTSAGITANTDQNRQKEDATSKTEPQQSQTVVKKDVAQSSESPNLAQTPTASAPDIAVSVDLANTSNAPGESKVETATETAKQLTDTAQAVNSEGDSIQKSTTDSGPVASREDMEVIPANPVTTSSAEVTASPETPVLAERKFDEVYNVLVRKKSGLYELYTREYELDKKLQGRVVFEITITPHGKISNVEVISNTLESPTLEQEFVDYLKTNVDFPGEKVADFKITYPVDFLPP